MKIHPHSTSTPRRLAVLVEEEAEFVECAFSCLLPEQEGDAWRFPSAAAGEFVDERLQAGNDCTLQLAIDLDVREIQLTGAEVAETYRSGIAAVQRYCLASYGAAFQDLPAPRQHLVLSLLERGASSAGLQGHDVLFSLLVQHAAEAYLAATQIALVRTGAGGGAYAAVGCDLG